MGPGRVDPPWNRRRWENKQEIGPKWMGLPSFLPSLRNVAADWTNICDDCAVSGQRAAAKDEILSSPRVDSKKLQIRARSKTMLDISVWHWTQWTVPPFTPIHYVACADRRYRYLQSRHRASKHPWAERVVRTEADSNRCRWDSCLDLNTLFQVF